MTTFGLVLDCSDPEMLAEFWSTALGYTVLGAAGNYVLLVSGDAGQPKLLLQRVPEAKAAKNRMHLDIVDPHGGPGRQRVLHLRRGRRGRMTASDHGGAGPLVETMGFEPTTPCLQSRCSAN